MDQFDNSYRIPVTFHDGFAEKEACQCPRPSLIFENVFNFDSKLRVIRDELIREGPRSHWGLSLNIWEAFSVRSQNVTRD